MVKNEKLLELLKGENYDALYEAIMNNIREESAKGIGKKNQLTLIKKIIAASKRNYSDKSDMMKAHPYGDKYAFIDGHRIYISENLYDYEVAENPYPVAKMLDPICFDNLIPVKVDVVALETFIKTNKKNQKPFIIKFNEMYIGVNANFLKEGLQYTNSDTIYLNPNNRGVYYNVPLFLGNGSIEVVILPICIKDINRCDYDASENQVEETVENQVEKVIEEKSVEVPVEEKTENLVKKINSIAPDVNEVMENNQAIKNLDIDKRIAIAERYDKIISIFEDASEIGCGVFDDDELYDHINYKLYTGGLFYAGVFDENTYDFKYSLNNKADIHYNIINYAYIAIKDFIKSIIELEETASHEPALSTA